MSKNLFEEIKINAITSTAAAINIICAPNSKYQSPNIETPIIPIILYNCSTRTIGAVYSLGNPNYVFNSCDFISSPIFPGVIDNAKPDRYIFRLSLIGTCISEFFSNKFHLVKIAIQLRGINNKIIGK